MAKKRRWRGGGDDISGLRCAVGGWDRSRCHVADASATLNSDDVIAYCKLVLISFPAFSHAHHPRISSFIARHPNELQIGPNRTSNN